MFDYSQLLLVGWTPGWLEISICAGIFILLFGSQKLPTLMRNMGRSVNEFKAGMSDKPTNIEEGESDPAP
jgi:sec-independent protein translocase protein TatA